MNLSKAQNEMHKFPSDGIYNSLVEAKEMGFNKIRIAGGDPVVHPNFHQLIKLIFKLDYQWSITSTPSRYKEYEPAILIGGDKFLRISLKLLGGTEDTHDHLTWKGSFNHVIESSRYFKNEGIKVYLILTINSLNIDEVPIFVNHAIQMKVDGIELGSIIPTIHNEDLIPDWSQRFSVYRYVISIMEKLDIPVNICSSLYTPTNHDNFCKSINDHKPAIDAHGDYLFCINTIGQGAILGNVNRAIFSDLYLEGLKSAAWLKNQRKKLIEGNTFFRQFNSCYFCNIMLEKRLQGKINNE